MPLNFACFHYNLMLLLYLFHWQALCSLTINYSIVMHEPSVMEHSVSILTSAQWGKRLGGHKISFTEAFRGGMEERKKVASILFRSKHVKMELILEYCRYMYTVWLKFFAR